MRVSKIIGTVKIMHLLLLLVTTLLALTLFSEVTSFYKLENLQKEKELVLNIYKLPRNDLGLANIQLRGDSAQLKYLSSSLSEFYSYDYINNFSKKNHYRNSLVTLQNEVNNFYQAAQAYFSQNDLSEEELTLRYQNFSDAYKSIVLEINTLVSQNLRFETQRFQIQVLLMITLLLLVIITLFVTRHLSKIEADFKILNVPDSIEGSHFFTSDAESISKNISRKNGKTVATKNPQYVDQLTGIDNYKGFVAEAGNKKLQSLSNYTAVCTFSIDRFSEIEVQQPQEFSEALIKKVTFMLSLYRQHNDVIGRLDHNKFAIFLSRENKATAFNDCELIRKSIEDTPFKGNNGQKIKVTLSGGFVQKAVTLSLEEAITKSSKVLSMSIQRGGNKIAQLRDKSATLAH